MATTQLADVFVPEVYSDYQAENSPEKSLFFTSGVVSRTPALDAKANQGGKILDVPFWKDLDADDEPNASTDDPTDIADPSKIGSGTQVARMAYLNNGWSTANLTGEIAGSDPMRRIASRTGVYWTRQWQRRLTRAALGWLFKQFPNLKVQFFYYAFFSTGQW